MELRWARRIAGRTSLERLLHDRPELRTETHRDLPLGERMKSGKDDFASRFGLRDLEQAIKSSPDEFSSNATSSAPNEQRNVPEQLYRALGRLLVRYLSSQPNKEGTLFEALEQLQASVEELL